MRIPLLVIAGPTASGKSAAAVELALRLGGEVVSADSMQVYKYMDIGTAKVDQETRARIPHHMLDIIEPDQDYSLAEYKVQAESVCKDIWLRGRLPIMAGGTGLYIKAITENYPLEHMPHDSHCREELNRVWNAQGEEYMLQWLRRIDPEIAGKISDRRRIIRALEIFELTGKAPSQIQSDARAASPFLPFIFALTLPRPQLYEKIEARTELMVIQGLIGEYISLIKQGYSPQCNSLQSLGYRHSGLHVQGIWSREEMIEHLKQDTRRYAKRQLTWFRGMQGITWLDNTEPESAVQRIYTMVAGKFDLNSENIT